MGMGWAAGWLAGWTDPALCFALGAIEMMRQGEMALDRV